MALNTVKKIKLTWKMKKQILYDGRNSWLLFTPSIPPKSKKVKKLKKENSDDDDDDVKKTLFAENDSDENEQNGHGGDMAFPMKGDTVRQNFMISLPAPLQCNLETMKNFNSLTREMIGQSLVNTVEELDGNSNGRKKLLHAVVFREPHTTPWTCRKTGKQMTRFENFNF